MSHVWVTDFCGAFVVGHRSFWQSLGNIQSERVNIIIRGICRLHWLSFDTPQIIHVWNSYMYTY